MESHASTRYDRLGAAAGVQRFLHGFYDRLLRDQRLVHRVAMLKNDITGESY
jgi:truncated hemoglobin YjbI